MLPHFGCIEQRGVNQPLLTSCISLPAYAAAWQGHIHHCMCVRLLLNPRVLRDGVMSTWLCFGQLRACILDACWQETSAKHAQVVRRALADIRHNLHRLDMSHCHHKTGTICPAPTAGVVSTASVSQSTAHTAWHHTQSRSSIRRLPKLSSHGRLLHRITHPRCSGSRAGRI